MGLLATALVIPLSAFLACAAGSPPPNPTPAPTPSSGRRLEAGSWGGQHVGMEITENGARLEYDCAHGTIDEPIVLDADGRFEAGGTQSRERPGPTRQGEKDNSVPASYTGTVNGDQLTLRVSVGGQAAAAFTLIRGRAPRLIKCQ